MKENAWGCSSIQDSDDDDDDEVHSQNSSDEEEFRFSPASLPKLQFRNTKSKGKWNEEMGMAEVFEKNGKMWVTTGIVRHGKIYTSIEETLYLMELEALDLLDNGDKSISLVEMYKKVSGGKSGCCSELFEAYKHLKSLGYIIARHNVAWSLKSIRNSAKYVDLDGTEEHRQLVDVVSEVEISIDKLFGDLKINDLKPDFDVYLPNNRFRKSSPGDPDFRLHLYRGHHPSITEIEALERQCGGVPLKIVVTEGRDSFFSFDKVKLPVLP
ncbi:uncharacterized protein LOC131612509 [Vicia villosa]|uniref:uncharacterized protein LOC131612509 n=1 Tax=Vicia villosa TaxID=3911 RepID=UPI00273C9254|nr:uncharacterized protein LOC131612509 [Vicia villosa]XP_058740284.1 uncharacterized protein LOC131612509 [Vicia villosa]